MPANPKNMRKSRNTIDEGKLTGELVVKVFQASARVLPFKKGVGGLLFRTILKRDQS